MTDFINHPMADPSLWPLDPQLTFLNHGSFGACPHEILEVQARFQRDLESSPVAFYLRKCPQYLEEAREQLCALIDAPAEGVVFVGNASEGVSTVLWGMEWNVGDEVIISNHAYPACRHMLSALRERFGVQTRIAYTPFIPTPLTPTPLTPSLKIEPSSESLSNTSLERFQAEVIDAVESVMTPRTKLVMIDHITSPTALIFPVKAIIDRARARGVLSLIDGAHAPGHIPLSIRALDPDFYTGNAHKWLFTPKSCGFLYLRQTWRDRIHPLVVSHGYLSPPPRLHALFDWTGTRDYSPWLSLPHALRWIDRECGDPRTLYERNHRLTEVARALLVETLWGAHPPALPPTQAIGSMATIPLPAEWEPLFSSLSESQDPPSTRSKILNMIHPLQERLYQAQIEVPVISWTGGVSGDLISNESISNESISNKSIPIEPESMTFIRVSVQAYNSLKDYHRLSEVLLSLRALLKSAP